VLRATTCPRQPSGSRGLGDAATQFIQVRTKGLVLKTVVSLSEDIPASVVTFLHATAQILSLPEVSNERDSAPHLLWLNGDRRAAAGLSAH
jgi:hypothetical protein